MHDGLLVRFVVRNVLIVDVVVKIACCSSRSSCLNPDLVVELVAKKLIHIQMLNPLEFKKKVIGKMPKLSSLRCTRLSPVVIRDVKAIETLCCLGFF